MKTSRVDNRPHVLGGERLADPDLLAIEEHVELTAVGLAHRLERFVHVLDHPLAVLV